MVKGYGKLARVLFSQRGQGFQKIKKDLQKKVSKANKRLKRLEKNEMQDVPAYRQFKDMKGEGGRFTSAGDDYNELQKEQARVDKFLNSKTSTVRGANKNMKEIAKRTGIKYKKVSELPQKTKNFFEMSSKYEQYKKNVEGSEASMSSEEMWEQVSQYVQDNNIDLNDPNFDVGEYMDGLIEEQEEDDDEDFDNKDWFNIDYEDDGGNGMDNGNGRRSRGRHGRFF